MYDDAAVYVAVRLFDPSPDSVLAPYPRRDDENTSDWVFVEVDTRFDRRSGYSFGLNPRGVQVDGTWSNDVDFDTVAIGPAPLGYAGQPRCIPWSQWPGAQHCGGLHRALTSIAHLTVEVGQLVAGYRRWWGSSPTSISCKG
jgi:hypothetical protein